MQTKMERNREALSLRLPPETKSRLESMADERSLSLSEYVRFILEKHVEGEQEIPFPEVERRVGPSSETYSLMVGRLLQGTVATITKETYMLGYRDGRSVAAAREKT